MSRISSGTPRSERGVILFIALIVLVAMSLAGIALMRSVDTNVLIAGNLAFRQGATLAADRGVENAKGYLAANAAGATLFNDQPVPYYWANWQAGVDLIGIGSAADDYNWNQANNLGSDAGSNEVRYVIHRLCTTAGDPSGAGTSCVKASVAAGTGASASGTKGVVAYGTAALPGISSTYYRVTVRVTGPRNSVSYVQAVLN
jgi:Tfp pilus assembly protein PilX